MTDEETTTTDDDETTTDDDDTTTDDDAELEQIRTDPLAAKRTIAALHAEAAEFRRKLRKAESELEHVKTEGLSEQERAVAEAELRGRQTADAEHGRKLLEAQLRAAAAGKLQDPADAIRYLDVGALLEDDADERELEKRVAKLVEEKPYLAANGGAGGDGKRVGVQSQGARTAPGGTKETDGDSSAWLRKAVRKGG
jgi:hypothetical protein